MSLLDVVFLYFVNNIFLALPLMLFHYKVVILLVKHLNYFELINFKISTDIETNFIC